jgi:hypothetical protein
MQLFRAAQNTRSIKWQHAVMSSRHPVDCCCGGDLDIYLAMADGVRLYEPKSHSLLFHMSGDLGKQTTTGETFVAAAPLNLIYAVDTGKMKGVTHNERTL